MRFVIVILALLLANAADPAAASAAVTGKTKTCATARSLGLDLVQQSPQEIDQDLKDALRQVRQCVKAAMKKKRGIKKVRKAITDCLDAYGPAFSSECE